MIGALQVMGGLEVRLGCTGTVAGLTGVLPGRLMGYETIGCDS